MSKVIRKWVQLDWESDGALRSLDIPYSQSSSVTTRLDSIKDATDQSIRVEQISTTPPAESDIGKLYTKNGEMFFLDESGNEIRLTRDGKMASITRTNIENHTEYFVLSSTDITNKYIDLTKSPDPITSCEFSLLGGNNFEYGEEFAVIDVDEEEDKMRLTWDSSHADVTTGISSLLASDVVKVNYLAPEEEQGHSVDKRVDEFTLNATDASTNYYVSLTHECTPREGAELIILAGGVHLEYTEDFVVNKDSNGEYKKLSWAAADTTTGLESVLQDGDKIKVVYTSADKTQLRDTEKKVLYVELTSTDVTNKYVDLTNTPVPVSATEVSILGGSELQYTTDFTVIRNTAGEYRRLNWNGLGIDGVVTSGDILKVAFMDGVGLIGAIRVSDNDVNPTFLTDKLVAGTNITISVNNEGGEETLTITAASGADKEVEYVTLTGTDITNKYIDLGNIPTNANESEMTVIGGPDQHYGVDYAVITDGTDIKRLTWDPADSNVSGDITGKLEAGDILKVSYIRTL